MLGHYDPSHNAIILSKLLDRVTVPQLALEYVLFHEMLHLRFPVEQRGARRCVHTRDFREAEKKFDSCKQAKELLHSYRAGKEVAVAEIERLERIPDPANLDLADAPRVLARAYGF